MLRKTIARPRSQPFSPGGSCCEPSGRDHTFHPEFPLKQHQVAAFSTGKACSVRREQLFKDYDAHVPAVDAQRNQLRPLHGYAAYRATIPI